MCGSIKGLFTAEFGAFMNNVGSRAHSCLGLSILLNVDIRYMPRNDCRVRAIFTFDLASSFKCMIYCRHQRQYSTPHGSMWQSYVPSLNLFRLYLIKCTPKQSLSQTHTHIGTHTHTHGNLTAESRFLW